MSGPEKIRSTKGVCRVLVIEDSDGKWSDIEDVLSTMKQIAPRATRAKTLVSAERLLLERDWDLVLLDVSMEITASSISGKGGGHDALGGLHVAHKMYLLNNEVPTIIVTAFDAFPRAEGNLSKTQILGLEDVQEKAAAILGKFFRGCVRYGDAAWKDQLCELIEGALR